MAYTISEITAIQFEETGDALDNWNKLVASASTVYGVVFKVGRAGREYIVKNRVGIRTTYATGTIRFILCGPVPYDSSGGFDLTVDERTGDPNLPIIGETTLTLNDSSQYGLEAFDYFNIGSGTYNDLTLSGGATYAVLAVIRQRSGSQMWARLKFSDIDYFISDAWQNSNYYSVKAGDADQDGVCWQQSNLGIAQRDLYCFKLSNILDSGSTADGSWNITVSAPSDMSVFIGPQYYYNKETGVPSMSGYMTGTSITWSDIPPTTEYIWVRSTNGEAVSGVNITVGFMKTEVAVDWHGTIVYMNSSAALPTSGSETYSNGLGEKEVLVYKFKLQEAGYVNFSYSGSESFLMFISTTDEVNSRTGLPNPESAINARASGTSISLSSNTSLSANTWYYLFIENDGSEYSGNITIYYTAPGPILRWTLVPSNAGSPENRSEYNYTPNTERTVYRIAFTAARAGVMTFSTLDATSAMVGYLTSTSGFDDISGAPTGTILAQGNGSDSSPNISFTYTIPSANVGSTTYYLWLKLASGETGSFKRRIDPPWKYLTINAGESLYAETSVPITESDTYCVRRIQISCQNAGTLRVTVTNTTGSARSMELSISTTQNISFDTQYGRPSSRLTYQTGNSIDLSYSTVSAHPTYYWLWVKLTDGNTGSYRVTVYPPGGSSVELWNWNAQNGPEKNATTVQVQAAWSALYNGGSYSGGQVSGFSYLVWNDLCAKLNEVVTISGRQWQASTATLANTKMTANDRTMTAVRFNAVRDQLNQLGQTTGVPSVSRGDRVLAVYFVNIATCINQAINNL